MTLKEAFKEQCLFVFAFMFAALCYEVIGGQWLGLTYNEWMPKPLLLWFYFCCLTIGTFGKCYFNNRN